MPSGTWCLLAPSAEEQHRRAVAGSSAAWHCLCLPAGGLPTSPGRQHPAALRYLELAGGCHRSLPRLCSRKPLASLPLAQSETHSDSAELAGIPFLDTTRSSWLSCALRVAPCGTMVTHNPLGGLFLSWWHGVSPGLPTLGMGPGHSRQDSHLPETVVGIQGPLLSLASQRWTLQPMWG